jgi:hypothetical protein
MNQPNHPTRFAPTDPPTEIISPAPSISSGDPSPDARRPDRPGRRAPPQSSAPYRALASDERSGAPVAGDFLPPGSRAMTATHLRMQLSQAQPIGAIPKGIGAPTRPAAARRPCRFGGTAVRTNAAAGGDSSRVDAYNSSCQHRPRQRSSAASQPASTALRDHTRHGPLFCDSIRLNDSPHLLSSCVNAVLTTIFLFGLL